MEWEYIPSSSEDRKLHDKYHKQSSGGYDMGKDFVQRARASTVFKGAITGDSVCMLDCFDKPARKRRGQAVLEIVQRELGAVEIPANDIWDLPESDRLSCQSPKFSLYLYIREQKCIGLLLAQRIKQAYMVAQPAHPLEQCASPNPNKAEDGSGAFRALKARQQRANDMMKYQQSQPIELSKFTQPACLGISRIWTLPVHRRGNIATTLLDIVFEHYNQPASKEGPEQPGQRERASAYNVSGSLQARSDAPVPATKGLESKDVVAFSQPTEAGTRLARRWFGKMHGWGVYLD